jgi:oligosaccharide repeat unit polymerase
MFIIATIGIIYNKEYWAVTYSLETAIVVLCTLAIMVLAEVFVIKTTRGCRKALNKNLPKMLNEVKIIIPKRITLLVVVFLGILTLYYVYAIFKIGSSLGVSGLLVIGATKYSQEGTDTISRIGFRAINMFYFIYAYIVVNNTVVCKMKIRENIIYLLPLIFGFVIMFFAGSRKLLVQYPMALVLMYIIKKRDVDGRKSISTKELFKKVLPVCLLILIMFYGMREISKSSTTLADRTILDYLMYYISSPLYLLDRFIQNPSIICPLPEHFGQYTFLGFYNTLSSWGILDFEVPFNNFQILSIESYMAGNEFTWIQRPYQDFGFLGMLILTFVFFYLYNKVYYKSIICRPASQKRDLSIILYSYFYFIVVLCFYCAYTITEVSIQSVIYMGIIVILYKLIICRKSWQEHSEGTLSTEILYNSINR